MNRDQGNCHFISFNSYLSSILPKSSHLDFGDSNFTAWTQIQQKLLPHNLPEMNPRQKNPQHVANVDGVKSNAMVSCPFAPSVESTDDTVYTTNIAERG